jgi:hypothetical protein
LPQLSARHISPVQVSVKGGLVGGACRFENHITHLSSEVWITDEPPIELSLLGKPVSVSEAHKRVVPESGKNAVDGRRHAWFRRMRLATPDCEQQGT